MHTDRAPNGVVTNLSIENMVYMYLLFSNSLVFDVVVMILTV